MTRKRPAHSYTFEITEEQRNLVLDGLVNKALDTKRYLSGAAVPDEPEPTDACCAAHLAHYEHRRGIHVALKSQHEAIEALIDVFSVEEDASTAPAPNDDEIQEHA